MECVRNVTTLAGVTGSHGSINGIGTNARFSGPHGVTISPDGVYALIGDLHNHVVRQIIISTVTVTTLAGLALTTGQTDGIGTNSRFYQPVGVTISSDKVFALVADKRNHLIRHIIISTTSVTTLVGLAGTAGSTDGIGSNARFRYPEGVTLSANGVYALVSEGYQLIRQIIVSTASVTTLAGMGGVLGSANGRGTNARFNQPAGISISPDGVYALATERSNHLIRHIIISTASVTTLTGVAGSAGSTNGIGTYARFWNPTGISISPDGVYALVAEWDSHLIRHIIISTANVSTLAGISLGFSDGIGTNARFSQPYGVSISPDGDYALVTDRANHLIRRIVTFRPLPCIDPTFFSFEVDIGNQDILRPGRVILVNYLQDKRRGDTSPSIGTLPLSPLFQGR